LLEGCHPISQKVNKQLRINQEIAVRQLGALPTTKDYRCVSKTDNVIVRRTSSNGCAMSLDVSDAGEGTC